MRDSVIFQVHPFRFLPVAQLLFTQSESRVLLVQFLPEEAHISLKRYFLMGVAFFCLVTSTFDLY